MSLGFSRFGSVVLVWFASSCLGIQLVYSQGQPQPRRSIELSETNSAEILTNLNLLSNRKEGSRQLEDQLRLLKDLSAPNSMEERFAVPYASPAMLPNKKVKELWERQKNWALTSGEISVITGSHDSDSLSGYGDDKTGSKKSLQQFYDTLIGAGTDYPNQNSDKQGKDRSSTESKRYNSFDENSVDDDSKLPAAIRDKTKELKALVSEDPDGVFNPTRDHSSFDNFFGLGGTTAHPDETLPSKTSGDSFLDQYKKGLDPASSINLNPALSALVPGGISPQMLVSPDLKKLTSPISREDSPSYVTSVPDPTALQDLNSTLLNQWNPMYVPSKLELPKVTYTPPTPVNLEFPRRRF